MNPFGFQAIEVDCPFCGRRIAISSEEIGPGFGIVGHVTPTCTEYDAAEDSLAFIAACNDKLERGRLIPS